MTIDESLNVGIFTEDERTDGMAYSGREFDDLAPSEQKMAVANSRYRITVKKTKFC